MSGNTTILINTVTPVWSHHTPSPKKLIRHHRIDAHAKTSNADLRAQVSTWLWCIIRLSKFTCWTTKSGQSGTLSHTIHLLNDLRRLQCTKSQETSLSQVLEPSHSKSGAIILDELYDICPVKEGFALLRALNTTGSLWRGYSIYSFQLLALARHMYWVLFHAPYHRSP